MGPMLKSLQRGPKRGGGVRTLFWAPPPPDSPMTIGKESGRRKVEKERDTLDFMPGPIRGRSMQRRSQVSLAGGLTESQGGINLNTYSYGKRDSAA